MTHFLHRFLICSRKRRKVSDSLLSFSLLHIIHSLNSILPRGLSYHMGGKARLNIFHPVLNDQSLIPSRLKTRLVPSTVKNTLSKWGEWRRGREEGGEDDIGRAFPLGVQWAILDDNTTSLLPTHFALLHLHIDYSSTRDADRHRWSIVCNGRHIHSIPSSLTLHV